MDAQGFQKGLGYEIRKRFGQWSPSSGNTRHDPLGLPQVLPSSPHGSHGRHFVAYHNTQRIFGFQYIPLEEMDQAIHGSTTRSLGDHEFKLSLHLLNKALIAPRQGSPDVPSVFTWRRGLRRRPAARRSCTSSQSPSTLRRSTRCSRRTRQPSPRLSASGWVFSKKTPRWKKLSPTRRCSRLRRKSLPSRWRTPGSRPSASGRRCRRRWRRPWRTTPEASATSAKPSRMRWSRAACSRPSRRWKHQRRRRPTRRAGPQRRLRNLSRRTR